MKQLYLQKGQRDKAIARREASLNKKTARGSGNATQIAFTFYVIAIAAKLARIDSTSNNIANEIDSFKEIFSIPDSEIHKVEGFYRDAVEDSIPPVHYARQLTNLFPNNRLLLEELIDDLFIFADADSALTQNKVIFLKEIVLALKFNENYFGRVLRKHMLKIDNDPFKLLDVSKNINYVDLKKAYRLVIRDCHPDKFASDKIIPELKEIAQEQFGYYSQAYDAIRIERGFNKKMVEA